MKRRRRRNKRRDKQIIEIAERGINKKNIGKMYGITESRVNQIINENVKKDFEPLDIRINKVLTANNITSKEQLIEVLKSEGGLRLNGIGKAAGKQLEVFLGEKLIATEGHRHTMTYRLSNTEKEDPTLADLYRQKEDIERKISERTRKTLTAGYYKAIKESGKYYLKMRVKFPNNEVKELPLAKATTQQGLLNEMTTYQVDFDKIKYKVATEWGDA